MRQDSLVVVFLVIVILTLPGTLRERLNEDIVFRALSALILIARFVDTAEEALLLFAVFMPLYELFIWPLARRVNREMHQLNTK